MTDYILLKAAQRYLERMQTDDQIRIINALDTLISNPTVLDIKPLKGRPELGCEWVNIAYCLEKIWRINYTLLQLLVLVEMYINSDDFD